MDFNPEKLFVGLMDFFSILLPGALLTFLLMIVVGSGVLGYQCFDLAGAQGWAAFLFASYLLGHLVFLIGSLFLDWFYDWARHYTLNWQIKEVVRRGTLLRRFARALIWLAFKDERNLAVERAGKIKEQALSGLRAKEAINTFQWSKAFLNAESPASLAVVQRFEADSKFFRSFVVVLASVFLGLLCTLFWSLSAWLLVGVLAVPILFILGLWRFFDQRLKSTNQAYWSVITLTARGGKVQIGNAIPAPAVPSHAGGVVFRRERRVTFRQLCRNLLRRQFGAIKQLDVVEYLLVEATENPKQWVLPKGHVEHGERHADTAVREVLEETRVWAKIIAEIKDETWLVDGDRVTTRFFLMEAIGRGRRRERDRRPQWLTLQDAIKRTVDADKLKDNENRFIQEKPFLQEETRDLLEKADRLRISVPKDSKTSVR